ncbi:hypothetical protein V7149_19870, partial [Bacillus sp. JJ1503]
LSIRSVNFLSSSISIFNRLASGSIESIARLYGLEIIRSISIRKKTQMGVSKILLYQEIDGYIEPKSSDWGK